jgi:hypothetical protein
MSRRSAIAAAFICAGGFVVSVCVLFNGLSVAGRTVIDPSLNSLSLCIPLLFLLAGKAFIWLAFIDPAHARRRRGLCTRCGYDLRASSDRCPECGQPIR